MKKRLSFLICSFWLISCVHKNGDGPRLLPQPLFRSDVSVWVDYLINLDALPPKELKGELDRLRRLNERSWDDELRFALANSLQLQKSHSYQKASDTLVQAAGKIQGNSDLRAWLKLYGQQVTTLALLDKELIEEKRQRNELEKKLKALSDIERDLSERSKRADIARP